MKPPARRNVKRIGFAGALILFICAASNRAWAKHPHYTFILPDQYVGWIQIVFNDPQASPLPHRQDGGYEIDVPESGVPRTSHLRVHDFKRKDEFYYRSTLPNGNVDLHPVPSEYVMPDDSHGGFGVMDTGGRGSGYSWFIFIGPPDVRAKVPLADWDKVVKAHEVNGHPTRFELPDPYPTPGRMPSVSARQ